MSARRPPELVVILPFEGEPTVRLVCFTAEDEQRLRTWLQANPGAVTALVLVVFDFEETLSDEGPAA
jgi:hypothetical protein